MSVLVMGKFAEISIKSKIRLPGTRSNIDYLQHSLASNCKEKYTA